MNGLSHSRHTVLPLDPCPCRSNAVAQNLDLDASKKNRRLFRDNANER